MELNKEILKLDTHQMQQHNLMPQNTQENEFGPNQSSNKIIRNELERNLGQEEMNYSEGEYGNQYQMQPPQNQNPYQEQNIEYRQGNMQPIPKQGNHSYNNKQDRKSVMKQQQEVERRLEEPVESLEERRKKGIKEIFDFYTRQHLMIGRKATFEQIQYEMSNMNMGEFMKF